MTQVQASRLLVGSMQAPRRILAEGELADRRSGLFSEGQLGVAGVAGAEILDRDAVADRL